jgi:cytochrome c-type biogenesis protein CcmE
MKPLHIALLIIASLGVAAVVSLYGNTTQIVSFNGADSLAKENPNKEYHIYCKLNKAKPVQYDPQIDPNLLIFSAIDSLGTERMVKYLKPKPQDLERAEKMLIIGKSEGQYFHAETIFSKCPSKYEDTPVNATNK